jgi:hypothetical protein
VVEIVIHEIGVRILETILTPSGSPDRRIRERPRRT